MMKMLASLDAINGVVGKTCRWLSLAMVLLTSAVVILRNHYGLGSIALQEAVLWMHGLLFLLGAGYTLQADKHVRVDVFYSRFSHRSKAIVNLIGSVFLLLPVGLFLIIASWGYVSASWAMQEGSGDAGGLPGRYLLKTAIPAAALLLLLQGLAEVIRNLLAVRGQQTIAHTKQEPI